MRWTWNTPDAVRYATPVLRVEGELPDVPLVAVVGSRMITDTQARLAAMIATVCVGHGKGVVSGLALGTDIVAHRAAMDAAGVTVAVLPSGLDAITPAEHRGDARRIVDGGGALVSAYPDGARARRETFLDRNQTIAAFAAHMVVVAAEIRSGSIAAARRALRIGTPVLAVPGSPGTDWLIGRQGVTAVTSGRDLDVCWL